MKLPPLDCEVALREDQVQPFGLGQLIAGQAAKAGQESLGARDYIAGSALREVREAPVVLMDPDERGVHREGTVVPVEEGVERNRKVRARGGRGVHRGSGRSTQRASWNERSTALMTSCTLAPSSKLPWLRLPPESISSMKSLIRLA